VRRKRPGPRHDETAQKILAAPPTNRSPWAMSHTCLGRLCIPLSPCGIAHSIRNAGQRYWRVIGSGSLIWEAVCGAGRGCGRSTRVSGRVGSDHCHRRGAKGCEIFSKTSEWLSTPFGAPASIPMLPKIAESPVGAWGHRPGVRFPETSRKAKTRPGSDSFPLKKDFASGGSLERPLVGAAPSESDHGRPSNSMSSRLALRIEFLVASDQCG